MVAEVRLDSFAADNGMQLEHHHAMVVLTILEQLDDESPRGGDANADANTDNAPPDETGTHTRQRQKDPASAHITERRRTEQEERLLS